MGNDNYLKDISEIKSLMHKSSRFISLSGLSGILAGIYALTGSALAYWLVTTDNNNTINVNENIFSFILIILASIAFLSIITAILLTIKKAKKIGEAIWDSTSKRLVLNFLTPLLTGGLYIIIVLNTQPYGQTAALMLIFYGLALISASKHSIGDIKYLGFLEITIGIFCALMPDYGFWLWVLGFGILHIIYGIWMYFKYDLKTQ